MIPFPILSGSWGGSNKRMTLKFSVNTGKILCCSEDGVLCTMPAPKGDQTPIQRKSYYFYISKGLHEKFLFVLTPQSLFLSLFSPFSPSLPHPLQHGKRNIQFRSFLALVKFQGSRLKCKGQCLVVFTSLIVIHFPLGALRMSSGVGCY